MPPEAMATSRPVAVASKWWAANRLTTAAGSRQPTMLEAFVSTGSEAPRAALRWIPLYTIIMSKALPARISDDLGEWIIGETEAETSALLGRRPKARASS